MLKNLADAAAEKLGSAIDSPSIFARFERFTAGFCMAIPFYLIVIDDIYGTSNLWLLALPLFITFIPLIIPLLVRSIENRNLGLTITLAGTAFLLLLYFFFVEGREGVKGSISAYVRMANPQIFGMLLSIAAMLFMVSGVVYWEKKKQINFKEGGWRSLVNLVQGVLLLGVVIIPCDTFQTLHNVVAVIFFLSCGLSTLARETKPEKRVQQRFVDFVPVIIMAVAMVIHFAQGENSGRPWNRINLFGAESIALWVVGIDFILVSLKREIDPVAAEKKEGVKERTDRH